MIPKRATWLNLGDFGIPRDIRKLIYAMLDDGDRKVVIYAHTGYACLDVQFSVHCAKHGYLTLLQWAKSLGCRWNELTAAKAALHGHYELLLWALSMGCPCEQSMTNRIANAGNLELLQTLVNMGCPLNSNAAACAAAGGHVHVLQWLHEINKVRFERYTISSAIRAGHIPVLEWMCTIDPRLYYAIYRDAQQLLQFDIVDWAKGHL